MPPSGHQFDCQKLLTMLNEALPDLFSKCIEHIKGNENECLKNILGIFLRNSLRSPEQITSYAVLCSEIAEAFGSDPSYNPLKVALARQLKTELENARQMVDTVKCRTQEELDAFEAQIINEKDKARRNALIFEQKARKRSRDEMSNLMKLFGELYNIGLLSLEVVRLCIIKLLVPIANAAEVDIEGFCILMKTAGAELESKKEGVEIADKYMTGLEVLIKQGRANQFCERIKHMIRELFYLRTDQWSHANIDMPALPEIFQNNEMIEEAKAIAKANKSFLVDLRAVVSNMKTQEDWWDFLHCFRKFKVWNEERLKGSVYIFAGHAMSKPDQAPVLALVCRELRDLSDTSAATSQNPKTFIEFLKNFCDHEQAVFRTNAPNFVSFKSRVQALKLCQDEAKFRQQKDELTKELKKHERPKNFTNFFGELFNAEVVTSDQVLDFFVFLMAPDVISDISIECLCTFFAIVASKMLSEPNKDLSLKGIVVKLSKAVNTGDFSMKARQLVNDLEKTAHSRFHLDTGFEQTVAVVPEFQTRLTTIFSKESLWTSSIKPKSADTGHESTQHDFFKKYLQCTPTPGPPPGIHGLHLGNRNYNDISHHV